VLKVVRWVYARAIEEEVVEHSPCERLKKPSKERPRDRVLTPAELRAVWTAAGQAGAYGAAVRLGLLTGARRSEVFDATRAEVDRESKLWRIPGERTKNGRAHDVPLVADALAVLDAMPEDGPFLFPGNAPWPGAPELGPLFERALSHKRPLRATSKSWERLLRLAGLLDGAEKDETTSSKGKPRKAWTARSIRFHDLRRTLRNTLTDELGMPVPTAEAVLGHLPPKIVQTYAPGGVSLVERRRALERWAAYLGRIVNGEQAASGNVVAGTFGA
jgi:integrase